MADSTSGWRTSRFRQSISAFTGGRSALAGWQLNHLSASDDFLSRDWIATQVARRAPMDNTETLRNPQWTVAFDRGLSPAVRDAVTARITDPGEIRDRLHRGPQFLTHYDFHHGNIGRADDDDVAIIDWAYVGWGPAGRDVGHPVLDTWDHLPDFATPIEAWDDLTGTYSAALREHGWNGNPAEALAGIRSLFPDASSILNISPINVWNVGHYHQDRRWTGEIDSAGPLIAAASRRSCRVFCADPC